MAVPPSRARWHSSAVARLGTSQARRRAVPPQWALLEHHQTAVGSCSEQLAELVGNVQSVLQISPVEARRSTAQVLVGPDCHLLPRLPAASASDTFAERMAEDLHESHVVQNMARLMKADQ